MKTCCDSRSVQLSLWTTEVWYRFRCNRNERKICDRNHWCSRGTAYLYPHEINLCIRQQILKCPKNGNNCSIINLFSLALMLQWNILKKGLISAAVCACLFYYEHSLASLTPTRCLKLPTVQLDPRQCSQSLGLLFSGSHSTPIDIFLPLSNF